MKLHHRIIGEGEPLFIIHGLFGSSDNWQTLGKKFAEDYQVIFVDQRNHGRSPHSDEFDYDLMVKDLHELITDLNLKSVNLLGHSMGGKTALGFAAKHPDLVDRMVVADMGFKEYPLHHDRIIEGLESIDLSVIKSRGQADKALAEYVPDYGVRQFLLKNLYWIEKGQLAWRINIPVLSEKIQEVLEAIDFNQINSDTLFLRGGKSNYIVEADFEAINEKLPNSKIHTIEESGHWIHAEAPAEFYESVIGFLGGSY
jgi:pimeloyl-ACP methyl ester carboxylesterase